MDYSPYGAGYDAYAADETPTGKYAPISAWGYFGYQLLFAIPVIGFICLLIFTFAGGNVNRRNFARSYWCALLVGLIFAIIAVILMMVTGVFDEIVRFVEANAGAF